ncbi:MAG: hypothetical protein Q7T79_03160 [bacterium]|nr:hypothetical protein [bacterium]
MYYKISQLILTPNQHTTSTSEVFVAQPDASKEALAGKLFVLIEIESRKAEDLKIINFLINTINHNYYQNEKIILREHISTLKVEHIFESALAKTNKKLAEFLQTEKIKLNPHILNITIGVIHQNAIYFTNLGKNKALLIYKNKAESNDAKYKLIDITGQTSTIEGHKQINTTKLFSNIISGDVPSNGYFIFTSETLPEYLSNKQIIDIITILPPDSAMEQIKNTLTKINAYVPFSVILIKNTFGLENYDTKKPIIERQTAQTSIKNFNTVEEKTEKFLAPSGLVNFSKWQTILTRTLDTVKSKYPKIVKNNKLFILKDKIFLKKRPSWLSVKKITDIIKNIFLYLINLFIFIYKIITDKEKIKGFLITSKQKIKQLPIIFKQLINAPIIWFKNLNKKGKIFLLIFTSCLLLFIVNSTWLNFKNHQKANFTDYIILMKSIEQKQNQVDASLLYDNEKGAKTILAEIKELMANLHQNTAGQKEQYDKIIQKNIVQTEKINKIIRVDAPTELTNFANLNNNAKPINIILAKEKIYTADVEQKIIYSLELAGNLATTIISASQTIDQLSYPSTDNNNNVYYLNSKSIIKLNRKTESLSSLAIEYNGDSQQFTDIKIFNNKLYCLNPKDNQVIRFNKADNKFTNQTNWLNNDINLTGAISIDIDGSVYILKNNGELLKFTKGKKEDFALETIEPALTQANKVIVSLEKEYIYILDTANKRLIAFNKLGKFINQYTSDKFNNLKDFLVDEKTKKIYFLNSTSIYSIDLQ